MLLSPVCSLFPGPVPISWPPWHDMSKPRVGIPVKKDTSSTSRWTEAGYRCTGPLPQTHSATCSHHIQQQRHSSQQSKGTEKKPTFETVYHFLFQLRSWGIAFLGKLCSCRYIQNNQEESLALKSPRQLYTEEPGCSMRQTDVLPGWSPTPQLPAQIITPTLPQDHNWARQPWRIFGMRFSQVRPGCHPDSFSPPAHKIPSTLLPESSGILKPLSLSLILAFLYTPHCSSLPVVSLHPLILLPFLTGPPQDPLKALLIWSHPCVCSFSVVSKFPHNKVQTP